MFKAAWVSVGIAILALLSLARTPAVTEAWVSPQTSAYGGATGEITGKALFEGTPPKLAEIHMDQDPVCVAKHAEPVHIEDGEVNSNGTLPNVFVYVKAGAEKYNFPVPAQPVILDQHGCVYEPHVLGIMVGQELRVVSSDATTHNIHPMPKENREWNQSQPPGAPPLIKRFTHPEIMIPVKCNQHPWMRAYIGVVANPFYAVTGSEGAFTIKGLPPGEYVLGARTATFGAQEQRVVVRANESTEADFTFRAP
jgi:hypothetical protein